MNLKQHFVIFVLMMIALISIQAHFGVLYPLWFYAPLGVSFLCFNPDILDKIFPETHRSFITHSLIIVVIIYWSFRPFLDLGMAQMFAIVVIFPVIVHLAIDLKIYAIFFQSEEAFTGTYQIWIFGKRIGKWGTIGYLLLNIIIGCLLIVWWS